MAEADNDEHLIEALTAFRLGEVEDPAFDAGARLLGRLCIRAEHLAAAYIKAGQQAKK